MPKSKQALLLSIDVISVRQDALGRETGCVEDALVLDIRWHTVQSIELALACCYTSIAEVRLVLE